MGGDAGVGIILAQHADAVGDAAGLDVDAVGDLVAGEASAPEAHGDAIPEVVGDDLPGLAVVALVVDGIDVDGVFERAWSGRGGRRGRWSRAVDRR